MTDAEKIEKIKEIVGKWALNDAVSAIDTLIQVMEILEFNPYITTVVLDHKESK